ncbi:MAG: hypothetical protein AB7E95_03770 [Kiritimatiellales bacterium]
MKKKYLVIVTVFIFLACGFFWLGDRPAKRAVQIQHNASLDEVVELLGQPKQQNKLGNMTVYYFEPNFYAAGFIRVGFNETNQAIYLKIWEDSPPQWDLRSQ